MKEYLEIKHDCMVSGVPRTAGEKLPVETLSDYEQRILTDSGLAIHVRETEAPAKAAKKNKKG